MTDPVESLLAFHGTRSFGSRENMQARQQEARATYKALAPGEQAALVNAVLAGTHSEKLDLDEVLCCLACFQPGSLAPFHAELVRRRFLYPGVIYHGAEDDIAARLLALVEEKEHRNHALVALAWVGNETVQRTFVRWREQPPQWASSLHVPPDRYAHEAGWELTPEGTRRNLYHETAFPLVCPPEGSNHVGRVQTGTPGAAACPWCGRRLTVLLGFEDVGAVLPGQGSGPLQVLTCDVCASYGTVFARRDPTGYWVWHEANAKPPYLPPDSSNWELFPDSPLVLSGESRHFLEAANWSMLPGVDFSQLGGLPTWVQDAEYPACPDCSRTMPFLGQISNEDFMEAEGIYYTFHCVPCGVTATTYQQT